MANLELVLRQLREERGRAEQQVNQLDSAIAALEGVNGRSIRRVGALKGRIVSALARRRMAAAQRARWAKVRRKAPSAATATIAARSRLSVAARRRIAAAQRARWAKFRAQQQKKAA